MKTYEGYAEAVQYAARLLLFRTWYDTEKGCLTPTSLQDSNTIEEAVAKSIGLGGGNTIHPHIGVFWCINYAPGMRVELLALDADDNIVTVEIPKSQLKVALSRLWNEHKHKSKQLTLF
jgi:hypothetical protein